MKLGGGVAGSSHCKVCDYSPGRMNPIKHGPRFTADGVEFNVWAPLLSQLTLQLDGEATPMVRQDDGWFSVTRPAQVGSRYAFIGPDGQKRPDPASLRQPEGVHGESELFRTDAFSWRDGAWKGVPLERMALYELHVGTFTEEGTLAAAEGRLQELAQLGVTCLELMPLQPFPGTRNWGYDGVSLHAVHEVYGGPAALQHFVDAAHAVGLAVCLDVVFNHFGPEGNYLPAFGHYLTSRHRSPWGDGLNYDSADAVAVRDYMLEASERWIREFHVDALRLDAVHAITDESASHLVAEISTLAHREGHRTGRHVLVFAESDLNDRKVMDPEPKGWGADAAWADDFHHALHVLLTGENDSFYRDFAEPLDALVTALSEGFVYQGQHSIFRGRPHGTDTRGLTPKQFVFCLQNHDQVGNRPTGERISSLVEPRALPAVAALVTLAPGVPLLFMGEEYGETRPFQYFTSHTDPVLGKAVSEGRKAEFIFKGAEVVPDPQEPATFERSRLTHRRDGPHGALWNTYRDLLALRQKYAEEIGNHWPHVTREGTVITLARKGFRLEVNLGPAPAGGLEGWGFRIAESAAAEARA